MEKPLHTKFIATLGPKSFDKNIMEGLVKAGANIFRCNFAHMQYDLYKEVRWHLGEINSKLGTKVELQADLQGLSIRLGDLNGNDYFVQERQTYTFVTNGGELLEGEIPINNDSLHQYVQAGQDISFLNGAIEGEIVAVEGQKIKVRMINSGHLRSHKSLNLPESNLDTHLPEKDKKDLEFLMEAGVEWVALSFVSTREEIEAVRKMIGDRPIKLISKVERRAAVANIDEVIAASDAIMVARGDLGIEMAMQEVPLFQKMAVNLCHHEKKPIIVATQMLLSMAHSPRPTRAEVSDVANAIFDRADAVMLSEETAEGDDPVNALTTMVSIVRRVEEFMYHEPNYFDTVS